MAIHHAMEKVRLGADRLRGIFKKGINEYLRPSFARLTTNRVVLQAKQDKSVQAKQDTKREQGNGGEGRGVCPWKEG
jgi:hypothetical protein